MNKQKILTALVSISIIALPAIALGLNVPQTPGGNITDVPSLINKILTPIWQIFVGLAVIMIIISGVLFVTAAGNPEKIVQARQAFLWAIVGIIVAIVAFSITTILAVAIGG